MALKENYKDDILDVSVNTKRKYKMTDNGDGTVSFDDETVYTQEGDSFGASDINATNGKVNTLDSAVTTLNANLDGFKFYPTGTGIVGLIADDSAYTDEDGNYVIWGTATAEQLVEDNPNTYKSVPSTEDCRGEVGADSATPFSSLNMDLLWTNLSPTSPMGATTINLDLSSYDAIKVLYAGQAYYEQYGYAYKGIALARVGTSIPLGGRLTNNPGGAGKNITVTSTGVSVSDSASYNRSGEYGDNGYGVPLKIWGIKPSRILDDLLAQS